MADLIQKTDTLNEGRQKLNKAIENVNTFQRQIDEIVVEGDSSVEAAQARVDADGKAHASLKARLDAEHKSVANVFRSTPGGVAGSEAAINVVEGYEGNAIAPKIRGSVVSGGGGIGQNNVIGGFTENVIPGNTNMNQVDPSIDNAHYSVIGGGYNNVANALASIITGYHCIIEKEATHGTISGGSIHKIIDGDYATIGGGTLHEINVVDGGSYATIAGGQANKITGKHGTITGGWNNEVSGALGHIAGGANNKAIGVESSARGSYGIATNRGQHVIGGGRFTNEGGDAQASFYVLRRRTTDATVRSLGYDNYDVVPAISAGGTWKFYADVTARSGDAVKNWEIKGLFSRTRAGVTEFLGTPEIKETFGHGSTTAWSVTLLAGTGTLNIRITGVAGQTIDWVGTIETKEIRVN